MNHDYTIRLAKESDIDALLPMYDYSRTLMRAAGNTVQWVGYPTRRDLAADIAVGASYVVMDGERPAATFSLVPGREPTYGVIVRGRWITPGEPYVTFHRLAKREGVKGVAKVAMAFAKSHYTYLRADTHESNRAMRAILEAEGFVRSGIVFMDDGTERVAYEWWRYDEVPLALRQWVETEVLPQYDHFDSAHRRDHARRVIARAMAMGNGQCAAPLCYAAAAMHDLGLSFGRDNHHLESGRIVRSCSRLQEWFTEAEVEMIAQAVEDHRASATNPPRSLLGCIVAEADRDVEPETIVRRTVEYGMSHYPELDIEGHWQRTLQHLDEKYSEHGYIKLWLADSPNAEPLAELRELIMDEARLRKLFLEIIK